MTAIRLTGAVMAHPRRLDTARALIASAPPGFLDLVLDPEPDGPPTGLRTSIRAWSQIPVGSTHHLVLEDDARLTSGFRHRVERAVASAPDSAVVLFTQWASRGGAAVRLGALAGARWVEPADEYTANVALVLPAAIGAGFPDYAREHAGTWPDDVVLARYLRSVGAATRIAVPNLVEHGEFPSLSGNDLHGLRMSACYADPAPDGDPPVDVLRPDVVPFFKFGLALCSLRRGDRWLTVGWERYSRHLGIDAEDCRRTLAETPALEPARAGGLVRDDALEALWRTGYALGFLSADHRSAVDWSGDPLVDEALGTLGPGGLCAELSAGTLRQVRSPLKALAREALFAGARRPVRAPASRRVVLAGGDGTLRRALTDDLSDRGHSVRTVSEVDDARSGEVVVRLGERDLHVGRAVLRFGTPYGPGIVGGSPLNDLVLQSLVKQPMRVATPSGPYRFAHVWDIATALDEVVRDPGATGVFDLSGEPVTLRGLAELISRVLRSVEIDVPAEPNPAEAVDGERGRWPSTGLADGIRTVGQWLAYEVD